MSLNIVTGGASPYGSGTLNHITKWTPSGFALGDSVITENGTIANIPLAITISSTDSTRHAVSVTYTPVNGVTTEMAGINVVSNGTIDTTAGQVVSNGINVDYTTTRGAGANVLLAQGVRAFVTGGQNIRGGRFAVSGGGTTLTYGVLASTAGVATDNYGVNATATGVGTTNYGMDSTASGATTNYGVNTRATGAATANYGVLTTATGATNNYALVSVDGNNYLNSSSGTTSVGFAVGSVALGKLEVISTDATLNGFRASYFPTNGTVANVAGALLTTAGTFDTTAGSINTYAVNLSATGTRSAGANNLNNFAIIASASGGQTNKAIRTTTGDIELNFTSGDTTIGSGTTGTSTLTFNGRSTSFNTAPSAITSSNTLQANAVTGTFDTTAGVLSSIGHSISVTSTRSAGANNLTNKAGLFTASGAQVNIAVETTDGNNYLNTTSGSTGVGIASGGTISAKFTVTGEAAINATGSINALTVSYAPTASTAFTRMPINVTNSGTWDTTPGAGSVFGIRSSVTASRSAGANALTSIGIQSTVTGAQVNIAFQSIDGANYFNTSSGNTGIGVASGGTLSAKLHVTGDCLISTNLTVNGNAFLGDAAGDTIKFYGGTGATQQTPSGSRGGNAALASLLTALALTGLIVDGTSA